MILNWDCVPGDRFMARYRDRYCYFGGGSKTETKQETATNKTDPVLMGMLQDNYAGAQGRANSLTPYTGQITAGFNPTQTQAQGIFSGIAQDPKYAAATQQAMGTTQGLLSANPNTQVTAQPYQASQLSSTDLSPYLNPYTKNVIDTTLSAQERGRQMQTVNDNQAATAAGAFGGSRSGVANALTNEAYDRNTGSLVAGLNQANYGQAQQGALSDIGARNAASQFNSAQGVNTQQQSISNALAQAGFKLNAAGQLESLNQADLQRATQQGGILSAVGDAQQAQQQKELDGAYQAYMQGQQLTMQQQQMLNSALGLIPNQQTITSSGTGTSKTSGDLFGGILGAIAGGAKIGASMYGG